MHRRLLILALAIGCDTAADSPAVPDDGGAAHADDTAQPAEESDDVTVAVSELSTTAEFFTYEGSEATIAWFAVLDENGHAHVAFDACDVCYRAGLGYRQEGDRMVCNNCGNSFAIDEIGTANVGGGCWPGYLEAEVGPDAVVIDPDTLEAGSWYFE